MMTSNTQPEFPRHPKEPIPVWHARVSAATGLHWAEINRRYGKPIPVLQAANDNGKPAIDLSDWTSDRFAGKAPAVDHLISNSFAKGQAGMLVAMGDTGKSFGLLEAARQVAFGAGDDMLIQPIFGGQVQRRGTAVLITSEDSKDEVHRRLESLDERDDRSGPLAAKLRIVPLPSTGGPKAFWRQDGKRGLLVTDEFKAIRDQLCRIPDLQMVAFDPLSSFAQVPINEDPIAGQFVCTSLANLAEETGAAVIVSHHMKKLGRPIEDLADAREAVRGTTALVDGVRLVYCLWPAEAERARRVCKELRLSYRPGLVVLGGPAKANGAIRKHVATYVRGKSGLLVDRSADLETTPADQQGLAEAFVAAISGAAARGLPFTKTGQSGLHAQRTRLPADLAAISRHKLEAMADEALARGDIVACAAKGSSIAKWLDVPSGMFALGLGEFRRGAEPSA